MNRLPLGVWAIAVVGWCRVYRHAAWHSGDLPRNTALEASDDVFRHAVEGHPSRLQEVHARCNYTAAGLTVLVDLRLCYDASTTTASSIVVGLPRHAFWQMLLPVTSCNAPTVLLFHRLFTVLDCLPSAEPPFSGSHCLYAFLHLFHRFCRYQCCRCF